MSKNPHKKVRRPAAPGQAHVGKAQAAPDRWVALLALLGMLLTAYLTFTALSDGLPAFCTQDSSCDLIQHSRWSRIFGVPLALWGFALYAVLAFSAWRLPAKLQRWSRLWLVALVGLAISLYMTLIGWLELDAFCVWCLLSLALLAAIFVRLTLAPTKPLSPGDWRHWLIRGGLAALVAVVSLHLYYSDLLAPREDPRMQALASHLERSGAKFYGAFWCPTCQEQKRLFGPSAKRLPYVECSPDGKKGLLVRACVDAEVKGYPTWVIRGRHYQQLLSPEELARYSRFKETQ
jgi:uncharacterized membrane protein